MSSNKYIVVADYQGGSFGMNRAYTKDEWIEQASEWTDADGGFDGKNTKAKYIRRLKKMSEGEVVDYICDTWQIELGRLFESNGKTYAVSCSMATGWRGTFDIYEVNEDLDANHLFSGLLKGDDPVSVEFFENKVEAHLAE